MNALHRFDPTVTALQRLACDSDSIEWEELPSMAASLQDRLVNLGDRRGGRPTATSAWEETRPAALEPLAASPFQEKLHGLAIREVHEPEVFRHFFG